MADTRKRWPAAEAAMLTSEIATTADGRDITRPWIGELQQSPDPRLLSSIGWGYYDQVLKDPEVMSTFQQRRRAVVSAEWDVLPGKDKDPRAEAAADAFKANLERIDFDGMTDKMLFAVFNGYAVAEPIWGYRDGLIGFERIKVRHARRFRLDKAGKLRLLTIGNMRGEPLPERKFWMLTAGGAHDDEPYGRGLAEWLFWPTLIKRNGIGFWSTALDKHGTPTAVGTYRQGTLKAQIDMLLDAMGAIATDSGIAIPEGMRIDLLEAAKSSAGDFEAMVRYMDETIAKVVLSQTMTTSDGASLSQAEVHAGVKKEVVTSDADLLNASFSAGPARWWTDLNFGEDVASPIVVRLLDEEADLTESAKTDTALENLGWVRTEDSFRDTYGDGYERAPPTAAPVAPAQAGADAGAGDDPPSDELAAARRKRAASFAEPDDRDVVDRAVDALIAGAGYTPVDPIMAPIADAIANSDNAAALDEALIGALSQADVDKMVDAIGRAGFALRVAAQTVPSPAPRHGEL